MTAAYDALWLNGWGTALADDIAETWTGTDGASWPGAWSSQVGTTIQSNAGQCLTAASSYAGSQALRTGLLDGDLTVRTQFTGTSERYYSIYARYSATGPNGYSLGFAPNAVTIKRYIAGAQVTLASAALTVTAAWYKMRFQWQGTLLRGKVWLDTDSEPGTWLVSVNDSRWGVAGLIELQILSGGAATAITGAWDDLAVHDMNTSPDITPAQVAGVTATGGAGAVTVRWTTQTGASSGYKIYRGGTLLGTAPVASQKVYTDSTGVVGTSYSYTVSAVNTAGEGSQSAGASAASGAYTPWKAWTTACGNRNTGNANILFVGDSISEGQGSSAKANRWQDLLVGALRTKYPTPGVPGGVGYIPGWYATYGPDSAWQFVSSWISPAHWEFTYGALGYRSVSVPVAGASMAATLYGTSMDLWSAGPGGTYTYQVDGGSVVPVDQSAHTAGTKVNVVLGGSPGSHTVTIDCSAGTAQFAGWTVYNGDETVGIVPYDSAHSGWKTAGLIAASATDYAGQILAWKAVVPDLVVIELGINEYTNAVSVAQIKANMLELIDAFKLFTKVPNILLVGVYEKGGYSASNGDTWAGYISMLKAIQAADPAVVGGVVDLYADMGTSSPGGYWSTDALHPSDTGHARIAGDVYAALPSLPYTGQPLIWNTQARLCAATR